MSALARALSAVAVLLIVAPLANGAKRPTAAEIWTHPDFGGLGIESVALLPVVAYDGDLRAEKQVENAFGVSLRPTSYRWVSPSLARDRLRSSGGDSLLRALRQTLTKQGRVDSLAAPRLCATLRTDAVLSVRVELWERRELEWSQSGKPSTTVQLRAALVDSVGRLLWTASGSENAEGTYQDAGAGAIGVRSSGTGGNVPITGQGGAPSFDEVLTRLFARWAPQFPGWTVTSAPRN